MPSSRSISLANAPAATRLVDSRARGALEDVAGVLEVVLQRSGEIGMAGTGRSDGLVLGGIAGFDGQFLFQFFQSRFTISWRWASRWFCRGARRRGRGLVGFDLHAAAAAIALLAAPKLAVHEIQIDGDAGRKSGNERNKCLAVGFAGCGETDHIDSIVREVHS